MIDIEFDIFDAVADRLRAQYPGIFVTGDVSFSPARFPAVSVVETGNSVVANMRTSVIENAALVMYEVNVYSNKTGYSKIEAKEILSVVDEVLVGLGFTRVYSNPVQNMEDRNVFRIVARYEATVDKDLWIYQS